MKLNIMMKVIIIILVVLAAITVILLMYIKRTYGAKMVFSPDMIAPAKDYDVKLVKQEEEAAYLAKENGGAFKILAFTDLHFDGMDQKAMDKTMEEFLKTISTEHPDLVIFTGDIVTAILNKERAEIIADIMESYGIYWCIVLGNHEGEHPLAFSRKNLIKLWADKDKYPHCLVEPGPKGISGYGNYVVNLLNADDAICQSLIFMDSGDIVSEEEAKDLNINAASYDFIKADQIDWYKEKINSLPKGTKSSLFIHIPLCEYATGWEAICDKTSGTINNTAECSYISGTQREPVCCSEYNSGLFDVMLSLGSTKAVFCGHDHVNDDSVSYKGIDLNYLQASGYTTSTYGWNDEAGTKTNILEEETTQGYTILDFKENGTYQITRIRYDIDSFVIE